MAHDESQVGAEDGAPPAPEVRHARRLTLSWIWIVPIVALLVAASLVASVWVRSGPVITVSFNDASGLEAGRTKLRYRDVTVGEVKAIHVAPDRQSVQVDVQLERSAASYVAREGARFWVVRPRVSVAEISGLDTILSGVYLSVDAPLGKPSAARVLQFQGLENPPEVRSGEQGTRFELHADSLGSLRVGSNIYYRRVVVGRLVSHALAPDGRSVQLQVFVQAPFDRFVTANTRFWNDSGVDMSVSAEGVQLRTSGLSAVLEGGIAFAQADESTAYDGEVDDQPADAGHVFRLFNSRGAALADPDGPPLAVEMRFPQSVRGLKVGAEVDFLGMPLGQVVDIDLEFDAQRQRFYSRVRARLYPLRFGDAYHSFVASKHGQDPEALLQILIEHGMRAQLRTGSLLTGQQYVALSFFTDRQLLDTPVPGPAESDEYLIPTVTGDFDRLQAQLSRIVAQMDQVPIAKIGSELQANLEQLRTMLKNFDAQVTPGAVQTLQSVRESLDQLNAALGPNSPLLGGVQDTLGELDRAARSLDGLARSLQAHPEALLRGPARDALH